MIVAPGEDEEPIIELAVECEKAFATQVTWLTDENELNAAKVLGEYQQRFLAWASFIGVFAAPNVCLDRRLRQQPDLQELVLRILDILERNLIHLSSIEEHSRDEKGQKHERINSDCFVAIAEAVTRLDRLSKAIRQSPATSQAIKVKRYAENYDLTSFEAVAHLTLRSLYPEATATLIDQLCQSMFETYAQFRYRKSRQEPLSSRRLAQPQLSTIPENDVEESPEGLTTEMTQERGVKKDMNVLSRQREHDGPSEYAPTSLDSGEARNKWTRQQTSRGRQRNTNSIVSHRVDYPQPPKNGLTCEWCFAPLTEENTEGSSWRKHINEDHKPYVCISETCAATMPRYASSTEWLEHMVSAHGQSWHRNVHCPLSWICPLCEDDIILPTAEGLTNHIEELHEGLFTVDHLDAIVEQSKVGTSHAHGICPLCCLSMLNGTNRPSKKRDAGSLLHESSSMITVVPESSKRFRTALGYFQRQNSNLIVSGPGVERTQLSSPATSSISVVHTELDEIGKHIAGHLQSIMLITLRLISAILIKENPTQMTDPESGAESLSASLGQTGPDNSEGLRSSKYSMSLPDEMSIYDTGSAEAASVIPDADDDWGSDILFNEDASRRDNFLDEAFVLGAFQVHDNDLWVPVDQTRSSASAMHSTQHEFIDHLNDDNIESKRHISPGTSQINDSGIFTATVTNPDIATPYTPPDEPTNELSEASNALDMEGTPGAPQLYEDATQMTRSDDGEVWGAEKTGDSDIWGCLIPLGPSSSDSIVLRSSKNNKQDNNPAEIVSPRKGAIIAATAPRSYIIGRHRECDIIVNGITVSNRHCLIFPEVHHDNIVAVVEDLSSNGTFVNEALVGRNQRRILKHQDEIAIPSHSRFMFQYPQNLEPSGFSKHYTMLEKLGKGHFAEVYACVEKSTGQRWAVKVFTKQQETEDLAKLKGVEQEIAVLMSITHPNIVSLKDIYNEDSRIFLVLDYAPEGELFNHIIMKQRLSEEEARLLFRQLFSGINYMHERSIVHRDVKPENILIMDKKLTVKIADFGLAKIIGENAFTTTLCGTPSYVAPEILSESRSRKYTKAVDIWSLGVVLYICLCGFPPFSDELYSKEYPYTLSQQIKEGRFDYPSPYWDHVGDGALDLIDSMLLVDPERRFTIEQCLEHPWLTGTAPHKYEFTTAITGSLAGLNITRRGVVRERTLLSSLNTVGDDGKSRNTLPSPLHILKTDYERE